jgi:hypothetical protein
MPTIPQPEFEFFVYDDDPDDPRFSFWAQHGDSGVCVYDRPPEGVGMWLKLKRDSDYDAVKPSDELIDIVARSRSESVEPEAVEALPPHERYFFQAIHGTATENPEAIPAPVWEFIDDCERRA